jgi:hypothetical protein
MLVKVLNFGTNWWARFGSSAAAPDCFTRHAAYYNSTGVRCGSKIRRHWIAAGLLRFNGVCDFNPDVLESALGRTFVCTDLRYAFGGNRVLFQSRASRSTVPDWYLVVVSSGAHGRIDFASSVWKSALAQVVAASQLRDIQEAMLLMKPGDWVQTHSGFWQLYVPHAAGEPEALVRIGDPIPA